MWVYESCINFLEIFKKQYFWRKLRKTHLWKNMTVLRGGASAKKNQYNLFFVGIDVLNIFHLTTFSKKKKKFQNNTEKLFLGGMTIFEETGRRMTKMNL